MTRNPMKRWRAAAAAALIVAAAGGAEARAEEGRLHDPREVHLAEVRQLTAGGENAEAYWSPDGSELIFQSTRPPYGCDQIFRLAVSGPAEPMLVSTGRGRTTCAYFTAGGDRVIYSSTHLAGDECPPVPDRSSGYVWPLYSSYEIFSDLPEGGDPRQLTDQEGYDAEATVCPVDGSIVFTSTRDGDLELYRMNADGSDVRRLTEAPGYDGGAFFSADCSRIVWRASRPGSEEELADYRDLLARGLVRPGSLELYVANADGSEARQVTYLGAASFAPYFFPSGERILFSSNHGAAGGREFDIWAVNVDGTGLERITYTPGFDGFPMFSPDGKWLAFASNRNQGKPGETDVYVARWVDAEPAIQPAAADRYLADVAWLAADERQGRGPGTEGLAAAAGWLEERFAAIGLEPAGEDGYRSGFELPVAVSRGEATRLAVDGEELPGDEFQVLGFSAPGEVSGEVVFAGYGIVSAEHGLDDYHGLDVEGKVVLVRRFTPTDEVFEDEALRRRFGDLRYKAFTAREHGAAALLIADLPPAGGEAEVPDEAPLPELAVDTQGDAGIAVAAIRRALAAELADRGGRLDLTVDLRVEKAPAWNIVGKLAAPAGSARPGSVLLGAHYDHLGFGGPGSLDPDSNEPHNGADDNASGTAALLEAARTLAARRGELERDVYFAAFSAEENGVLGSTLFVRKPPGGLAIDDLVAMINMDMVGRLRGNRLTILGEASAAEWSELVPPLCRDRRIDCALGGDGYGPSDHTSFYAAGVPVLYFFTGAHEEYHKPSDDWPLINAAGGARIAHLAADVAAALASLEGRPTYQAAEAPPPQGDARSYGASLGTIPDYAGTTDGSPGVLLAGVRAGSPAEQAGMRRGDLLVGLAGHEIRDINDFMFVLRQSKPGDQAMAAVIRDGERVELEIEFGARRRRQ